MTVHRYRSSLAWSGSTQNYESYSRLHDAVLGQVPLQLTADPAFRGDAEHVNPEQLLVAAASSCQLLSFLAVAAHAGVEVVQYTDDAEGEMRAEGGPLRMTRITLRPTITVRSASPQQVERLVVKAHDGCYVARSLRAEVLVLPVIEVL